MGIFQLLSYNFPENLKYIFLKKRMLIGCIVLLPIERKKLFVEVEHDMEKI